MAWEEGLEMHDTLVVTGIDTTSKSIVPVAGIADVSIALGNNAGVDTGGVRLPEVDVKAGDWLTGVHVNDLKVDIKWNTFFIFGDVLSDQLSIDVCSASKGRLAALILFFDQIFVIIILTYSMGQPWHRKPRRRRRLRSRRSPQRGYRG